MRSDVCGIRVSHYAKQIIEREAIKMRQECRFNNEPLPTMIEVVDAIIDTFVLATDEKQR